MTNKASLISVIMPVFNAEKYLDESIQSILNQTYSNFEFIIINDGSTDGSLEIIQSYAKKDERIKIITHKNKGLVYSLNEGIGISQGKYIARMDADDISLRERFKKQVLFLDANKDVGVCGTWIYRFGEKIKTSIVKFPETDTECRPLLLFTVPCAHPSVMIRRDVLIKYNVFYDTKHHAAEDYSFWVLLSKYTNFANLVEPLLKYRYLDTSLSRVADSSHFDQRYKAISDIFKEVIDSLQINNTEEENKLHFSISSSQRAVSSDFKVSFLNCYLLKIYKANLKTQVFDTKFLKRFLARRFLVTVFARVRSKDVKFLKGVFYRWFWCAIVRVVFYKKNILPSVRRNSFY